VQVFFWGWKYKRTLGDAEKCDLGSDVYSGAGYGGARAEIIVDPASEGMVFAGVDAVGFTMERVYLPLAGPDANTFASPRVKAGNTTFYAWCVTDADGRAFVVSSFSNISGDLDPSWLTYGAGSRFDAMFTLTTDGSVWLGVGLGNPSNSSVTLYNDDHSIYFPFYAEQAMTRYDLPAGHYHFLGIAESSNIVGNGPGGYGFVLTDDPEHLPIPEPVSVVMLGCLGAGMAAARKLRGKKSA
jgi:hypothetical protein